MMELELSVSLSSNTPVVACETNPVVRVNPPSTSPPTLPPYSLSFTWYREQIACCIHETRPATVQCIVCSKLKLPSGDRFHCSANCFSRAWKKHLELHCQTTGTVVVPENGDWLTPRFLRSCGSWGDFESCSLLDQDVEAVHPEGNQWVKVGSSQAYVPSGSDAGFRLRLVSVITDCVRGSHLSPICVVETNPVILFPIHFPRRMVHLKCPVESLGSPKARHPYDVTFTVLSYNILSDLYANRTMYAYCPTWALAWEYRRMNLLQEIVEYNADILCLQEVQSDHFEAFFKPELIKQGYFVAYKKRTKEVFTANNYITDGCATFYRRTLFKEVAKYELEFDKMASSVVDALNPKIHAEGSIRLKKDNIALVLVLESLTSATSPDASQPRICVANTHIHANSSLPDVKLFQVVQLIHGLEKISESEVPLLICGDLNSLPESDPHQFLVQGEISSRRRRKRLDPLGIYPLLKLRHSLPLVSTLTMQTSYLDIPSSLLQVSAYASFSGSAEAENLSLTKMNHEKCEPMFTRSRQGSSGTLDYILYTSDRLRVEGLLDLLDLSSIGAGLPSAEWSSDHIALAATFRLLPPSRNRSPKAQLPRNPWEQAETANLVDTQAGTSRNKQKQRTSRNRKSQLNV